jgi:uncharacterized protein YhaN
MKISRLDLKAFGPFTDEVLDLSAGECGLHLVYGPNEAGKSSALRALNQLLYGIPSRTSDDFNHSYANLRIGGALTNGDGSQLELLRRKAAKNDLRAADDNTVIEPGMLAKYLGQLDRETFETMFGIDHAALVRGGRDIVEGKGRLGQILFAAGSGIADLKGVQDQLEKEAGELFAPTAKKPRINAQLSAWEAARKNVAAAQLPSAEWERHDKALREAREQLTKTEQELDQARLEYGRLRRIDQAIPLVVRLNAAVAQIAQLGSVRILPERFGERRQEAVTRLASAESAARAAGEAILELDGQIEKLVVPEPLLARADSIEQLSKDLGSHRKAQGDLRETVAPRREQSESEARRLLKQLRPGLPLTEVETLRISRQQQVEIQNLGNKYEALAAQCGQASDHVAVLHERLAATRQQLANLPPPRDADLLKSVLRRAQSVTRIEEERAEAKAELARLEQQAAAALARLPLWKASLEALEQLAIPSSETIEAFDARLAEADAKLAALAEQIAKAEATRGQYDRQIAQSLREGEPPTELALTEARQRRDEGWRLVRGAWLEGRFDAAEARLFTGGDVKPEDLADAFSQSVRQADEVADRLRREADRVAARATLLAQRQMCLEDLSKLSAAKQTAAEARDSVALEWQSLWRPLGIEPQSPREMRAWERRQQALVQQAEAIRKQAAVFGGFDARLLHCRHELDRSLLALNEPAQQEETLAAQLERAQLLADQIDAAAAARTRLTDEMTTVGRQLETEKTRAAAAQRELTAWTSRWSAAVAPLGLSREATPVQANEILAQLDALFNRLVEADGYRERIEGIAREAEQFIQTTWSLLQSLGKNDLLEKFTVDQAADMLLAEYRGAMEDRGRLETLRKQRAKQVAQLAEAKNVAAQSRTVIESLCREANCDDPARLPEVEERSLRTKELRALEGNLHEQLVLLSASAPLEEFIVEVGKVEPDGLPSKLDELRQRVVALESQRDHLLNTVALESKELSEMDSGAGAAEAEEQVHCLAAEIAGEVETYVRLRLASAVLREAMERYRAKNQGPVLARASRLFADLTAGSFAGLRADYNERGEAILVGIRSQGERTVTVDGMSEGTADQLYLALRLASLEGYLDDHDAVPLIADDILINFDNERSLATLQVLAKLSHRTQVIFFTHHQHLVELAEQHLPPGVIFTHRLGAR